MSSCLCGRLYLVVKEETEGSNGDAGEMKMVARSDSMFDQELEHCLAFSRLLGVTVTELEARRVMG